MVRIKRGVRSHKRRKNVLEDAKGFRWGRKSKFRQAKDALYHAWSYAFRDRKTKKREFRKLWQVKISALSKKYGVSYSKLIFALKQNNIEIDRKILAQLAEHHPSTFEKVVKTAKIVKPAITKAEEK